MREEELDMLSEQDPIMEKAVNKLLYVSADEQLQYELDMREKAELDYWSAMSTNYRKGKVEGMKKGMKKGEKKGKHAQSVEIAKNLLHAGDPVDKVIQVTGLTYEEVESLLALDRK
jgi:predicted transposase/invertase (TIGR01784 family)